MEFTVILSCERDGGYSVFCPAVFVRDQVGFVELFTEGAQLLQRAAMPCAPRRHKTHAEEHSSVAPFGLGAARAVMNG